MISTTLISHNDIYKINLVECKDPKGFTMRFHFEIMNTKNEKCVGIFDRLNDAKKEVENLVSHRLIDKTLISRHGT